MTPKIRGCHSHTRAHTYSQSNLILYVSSAAKKLKEIQAAATVLSLKEYDGLTLDFPNLSIPDTLASADSVLSSEAATPATLLSCGRVLHATIGERRRVLDEALRLLRARDARDAWEKKMAEFATWAKTTCEGKGGEGGRLGK